MADTVPTVELTATCILDEVCTEGGKPFKVIVTYEQMSDGTVNVTLQVAPGYDGDLRGFFFDVFDDAILSKLVMANAAGDNVVSPNDPPGPTPADADGLFISLTDALVGTGGDNNMNGCEHDGVQVTFEAGVEFGAPGQGQDKLTTATFSLKLNDNTKLTLADLIGFGEEDSGVDLGLRATSVVDGETVGSSKLFGTCSGHEPIDISGTKYTDTNGDGDLTGDSPGTPGQTFTINLYKWIDDGDGLVQDSELTFVDDTETDADTGAWSFLDLDELGANEQYYVKEVGETGWTQTFGNDGYFITETSEGNDFGNFENITISGLKYTDANGDGELTGDSPGTPGQSFTINLYKWLDDGDGLVQDSELTFVGDTETDADTGAWSFANLGPLAAGEQYFVAEAGEIGWTQTFGEDGYVVAATSGGDDTDNDFGNFELFDISGTKWYDKTGDGITGDDTKLGGVKIYIDFNGNDQFDDGEKFAITADDGTWSITDLDFTYDGKEVREVVPTDFEQTAGNYTIVGTSGNDQTGLDFANFEQEVCFDGLSQGFWGTHATNVYNKKGVLTQASAWDDGLNTGDKYETIINVKNTNLGPNTSLFDGKTLLQVLTTDAGGNKELILGKQVVAALLNFADGNNDQDNLTESYRYTDTEIKAAVQQIYSWGFDYDKDGDGIKEWEELKNELEKWNTQPEQQASGELCIKVSEGDKSLAETLGWV